MRIILLELQLNKLKPVTKVFFIGLLREVVRHYTLVLPFAVVYGFRMSRFHLGDNVLK